MSVIGLYIPQILISLRKKKKPELFSTTLTWTASTATVSGYTNMDQLLIYPPELDGTSHRLYTHTGIQDMCPVAH